MNTEEIAKAAYQALSAYRAAIGENIPAWEERSDMYRLTAIDTAKFFLENPNTPLDIRASTNVQRARWLIHATVVAHLSRMWTGD